MKNYFMLLLLLISSFAAAGPIRMENFPWTLDDVAERGLSKEELFTKMPRKMLTMSASICSNRAMVWLYDFKQTYNINGSKIFMFYTKKSILRDGWWYHVAPIINENGQEWVMDGGFPDIKGPMLLTEWMDHFQKKDSHCYEITPQDKDLLQRMHEGGVFPAETHRGRNKCYFIKAPAGYWFPTNVATKLLGVDAAGSEVNYSSEELKDEEVYKACREAVTGLLGSALNWGKKKCRKFMRKGPNS